MRANDISVFRKLGLTRYIEGMNIHYILPRIEELVEISKSARQRLKWMDYYAKSGHALQTCRYFGISPKTFYKWAKIYDPHDLATLEDRTRRPRTTRQWQVTREEERRIVFLRERYIRYGKMKLSVIYQRTYNESISSWKIQRVIQKHQLYFHPKRNTSLQIKKHRYQSVKRITELTKEPRTGFLLALDTVVLNVYGQRRYILTGIDGYGKIAFARMYPGHGSAYAADFLKRLHHLLNGQIENIQTDNGSEFLKSFHSYLEEQGITHQFIYPRMPKINSFIERFNRTIQEEFILRSDEIYYDSKAFNRKLTKYLFWYNYQRPHASLNYISPMTFIETKIPKSM